LASPLAFVQPNITLLALLARVAIWSLVTGAFESTAGCGLHRLLL